nr:unnamed protein product [Callosobruchus analis]
MTEENLLKNIGSLGCATFPDSGSSYRSSSVSDSSEQQEFSFDEVDEETADTIQIQNTLGAMANQDGDDWVEADSEPTVFDVGESEGFKISISPTSSAKDSSCLTAHVLTKFVSGAQSLRDNNLPKHSSMQGWKSTSPSEFRRFIGICILMGNVSMPSIKHYWSHMYQIVFPKTYVGYFILEEIYHWMKRYYFGVGAYYFANIFQIKKPNGIALEILVYSGKGTVKNDKGHGEAVVTTFAERYLDKGHVLYLDNYNNSVKSCSGQKENTRRRNIEKSSQREKGNVLVLKWKSKRDVLMISSLHSAAFGKCLNNTGLEKE